MALKIAKLWTLLHESTHQTFQSDQWTSTQAIEPQDVLNPTANDSIQYINMRIALKNLYNHPTWMISIWFFKKLYNYWLGLMLIKNIQGLLSFYYFKNFVRVFSISLIRFGSTPMYSIQAMIWWHISLFIKKFLSLLLLFDLNLLYHNS